MKASSLPNLNCEPTSYDNFFTLFQDPNNHDDTTLNKHPNIDHSQDTEASETSPFKDILSPFVLFNEMNENHYPVGGSFNEWDWDQMDQTLPRWPPSPNGSDTNVSVGSNQFSSVSSNDGARMEEVWEEVMTTIASNLIDDGHAWRKYEVWTPITSNLIDDGHAWRKYGQKDILNAKYPRNYYRCTHRQDQGCWATKQVQKTDEDPPVEYWLDSMIFGHLLHL
jgi:hypothetical protein